MQIFQILGSVFLLLVAFVAIYDVIKNRYVMDEVDRTGRVHKRDIRTGKFVKQK